MRNFITLRVALLCVIYASTNAWAEAPTTFEKYPPLPKLTLQSALQKTMSHNPQLHQFSYTRERLLAERDLSALTPGYELGMTVENFAGSGEVGGFDAAEVTVALSSVIELGDKRTTRVSVADARLDRLALEKQAQTLDVLGDVTNAFIQVLTTQEELKVTTEAVALSESLYKTVQQRSISGAASDAEVMRAKAALAQSQLREEFVRQKGERQKISLAKFWGETNTQFSGVEGDLYTFGNPREFSELFSRIQQSPAIEIFASETRLKDAELRLAKTQNNADLNWQLGVRQQQASGDTGLTFGISMPLFSERRNGSRISAAIAERDAVLNQRTDRLLTLHERLFTAFSQRQQYVAAYQRLIQQIIPDLEKALSLTKDAYERGRLRYQDWIAAQQELQIAKQQLIETASAALLNQAVIEQLTAEPLTNFTSTGTPTPQSRTTGQQ